MAALLETIDFWPNRFKPEVRYPGKNGTILGGVFVILYLGVLAYTVYINSYELFNRTNPTGGIMIDVDGETSLNFNMSFGYSYSISKRTQSNVSYDQQFKDIEYLNILNNMARILTVQSYYQDQTALKLIPMRNCSDEDMVVNFGDNLQGFDYTLFKSSICMDSAAFDMYLYKRIGDARAKYVGLSIYECTNNTSSDVLCLSQEMINYYLFNYEIKPFYIFAGVMYKQDNADEPFVYFMDNFFSRLIVTPNPLKVTHYIDVQEILLKSDNGLFTKNETVVSSQQLEKTTFMTGGDQYSTSYDGVTRKLINEIIFTVSKNKKIIFRTYMRLTIVLQNTVVTMTLVWYFFSNFLQRVFDSYTKELILHQVFHVTGEIIANGSSENATLNLVKHRSSDIAKEKIGDIAPAELPNYAADELFRKDKLNISATPLNHIAIEFKDVAEEKRTKNIQLGTQNLRLGSQSNNAVFTNIMQSQSNLNPHNNQLIASNTNNDQSTPQRKEGEMIALTRVRESRKRNEVREFQIDKSNYEIPNLKLFLLSGLDHINAAFCSCFALGVTRKRFDYYKKVFKYVNSYTSVFHIANSIFELEKLKFILFDENQTALFEYKPAKVLPNDIVDSLSTFSKYYYFLKDLDDNVSIEEIKKHISENYIDKTSKKLLDLTEN